MSLARPLLAQMNMHDAGAGIEGGLCFTRHLLWRHRDVVLFRVGQYAVQRAGDHSLVAHGLAFIAMNVAICAGFLPVTGSIPKSHLMSPSDRIRQAREGD